MNRSIRVAAGLLIALPVLAAAQAIGPGFELERSGRYADAANVYLTTIHTDPVNIPALLGLEPRVYAALNEPDSVEAIARRWAGTAPRSETPYREWGLALVDHRMFADARRAYLAGRQAVGGDGTLAIELAELEQRTNNWEAAATEWARAVTKTPEVEPNAASQLADTPSPLRDRDRKSTRLNSSHG